MKEEVKSKLMCDISDMINDYLINNEGVIYGDNKYEEAFNEVLKEISDMLVIK